MQCYVPVSLALFRDAYGGHVASKIRMEVHVIKTQPANKSFSYHDKCSINNKNRLFYPAIIKMNKTLILLIVPCLVAFVMSQYPHPGFGAPYGGLGGGSPYAANQFYYNYGQRQSQNSRIFSYCKFRIFSHC